ncbi:hypothetical protein O3P69_014657 [Scylla paramamosain]|uniref:Uncharacterized protein n=1 Tax=Scylla paramamosain TaxID=85552 RepID=A0AAW0TXQ1_SCYPA
MVWQNLGGQEAASGKPPPPLFPISMTSDATEVGEIRALMLQDDPQLKCAVNRSRRGMDLEEVLQELEEKRQVKQEKVAEETAQRVHQLMKKRGRAKGSLNTPPTFTPLRSTLFDLFYAPSRPHNAYSPAVTEEVISRLRVVSNALALRATCRVTHQHEQQQEEEERASISCLTHYDRGLFQQLAKAQEQDKQDGGGVRVASMPYLPPNHSTVGAMLSVTIHRPVLSEMAMGWFIFQNFGPQQLASMSHTQLAKIQHIQHDALRIQAVCGSQNSEGDSRASSSVPCVSSSSSRKAKIHEVSDSEAGSDGQQIGSEEEEEVEADGSNSQQKVFKIHITSEKVPRKNTKRLKHELKKPNFSTYFKGNIRSAVGTSSTSGPQGNIAEAQAGPSTSTSLPQQDVTAAPLCNISNREETQATLEEEERLQEARKRAEELLFQRMLSVFFWPTIMKLDSPSKWLVNEVELLVAKHKNRAKEEQKAARQQRQAQEHEEVETSEYIQELVRKLREDIEKKNKYKANLAKAKQSKETKKKGVKRKRSPHPEPDEEKTEEQEEPMPPPAAGIEPPSSPSPPGGSASAATAPASPSPQNNEEEEEQPDSKSFVVNLSIAKNKKKLRKLKRSLIMKEVWEARRQGSALARKKRQKYRHEYQPRESRRRRQAAETTTTAAAAST